MPCLLLGGLRLDAPQHLHGGVADVIQKCALCGLPARINVGALRGCSLWICSFASTIGNGTRRFGPVVFRGMTTLSGEGPCGRGDVAV